MIIIIFITRSYVSPTRPLTHITHPTRRKFSDFFLFLFASFWGNSDGFFVLLLLLLFFLKNIFFCSLFCVELGVLLNLLTVEFFFIFKFQFFLYFLRLFMQLLKKIFFKPKKIFLTPRGTTGKKI